MFLFVFFAYALIGILFLKVWSLAAELRELRERPVTVSAPGPAREPAWTVVPPPMVRPESETPRPVVTPPPPPPPPPPTPTPPPPAPPSPERVTHTSSDRLGQLAEATGGWEQLIGGNLLNKLGALVLVIGIALFLSYSFANMGPAGRAFTGLGLSATLLAAGVALERHERYRLSSRGILASGWAGLYFTAYAMHALPAAQIIENPVLGTSLMLGVAAGMVLHSLRYRAQSLTALAYGCIFAALALSSLNTFVAISLVPLAASMLYLARRFNWHAMAVFAAAATYGVFLTRPDSGAPLATIEAMLVLFWLLFEAFDLLRIHAKVEATPFHHALFGINALAGVGASAALWFRLAPDSMWLFCSGAAALYLASTWLRFAMNGETYYEFSLGISAAMTGLAIVARVPGLWSSVGMMMEAEVLFLAALRLRMPVAKAFSWFAFVVAGKQILDSWSTVETVLPGGFAIHHITAPLVILAGLFLLNRYLSKAEPYWSYLASGLLALSMLVESSAVYLTIAWLVFAAILFEFGLRKSLREFRFQSYGVAVLSVIALFPTAPAWAFALGAVFFFTQTLRPLTLPEGELKVVRTGASTGAAIFLSFLIHRLVPEPYEALALIGASVILLQLALRGGLSQMLRPALAMNAVAMLRLLATHADGIGKSPETAVWVSFGGAALAYASILLHFLRREGQLQNLARFGSAVITGGLTLLTLSMLLPNPWVPIASAVVAVLFVELGLFAGAVDLTVLGRGVSGLSIFASVALAPAELWPRVALSSAIAAFQYWLHFRLRSDASHFLHGCAAALIVTATIFNEASGGMLTLSWSLEGIALLAAGFALRDRWLRLPGLALMLLCIGKVFFYDLRNLETVYRILSFIGLGLILLGVSWIYTRFKEQLQKLL